MGIYKRISRPEESRVFIMGDLHGHFPAFEELLTKVNFNKETDLVVSVGDLIDRGPASLQCLALIEEPWFTAVMGNHEEMAYNWLVNGFDERLWYVNGGDWYWDLTEEEQTRFKELLVKAKSLPLVIELTHRNKVSIIAHADYPSDIYKYGKSILKHEVTWGRLRHQEILAGYPSKIEGVDNAYFGHNAIPEIIKCFNINYIDTGCGLGGKLTFVELVD